MANSISLAKLQARFAKDKKAMKNIGLIQEAASAVAIWKASEDPATHARSPVSEKRKDEAIEALIAALGEEHFRKVMSAVHRMSEEGAATCSK